MAHYDLLVIGAGAAGSTAATAAAEAGRRVALVERDRLGGTCLNYGCDPTKALLHVAEQLFHARHARRYGLEIPSAEANWPAVQAWVDEVVRTIRGGTMAEARAGIEETGIDLHLGEARFTGPHTVAVGGVRLEADRIVIASGTVPMVPPIAGLAEAGFITNVQAVSLNPLPRRLGIIGGGPIGLEFAQIYHRFGVEVTVLEMSERLLPKDDRELADQLCTLLSREGIRMRMGVRAQEAQCRNVEGGKRLIFSGKDVGGEPMEVEQIEVDEILLATGRRPVLEPLDLPAAGVETDDDGVVVDDTLRTTVPHIWAAGDVASPYRFTPIASAQGRLAAHNAFASQPERFDPGPIPWVTYTDPSLAHVGQTEEHLREAGRGYRVLRQPLAEIDRARVQGLKEGMVKLLVDGEGQLLGGHILAPHAGDLLAPIVLAMRHHLPASALASTLLPYPTMAEAVRWAASHG